MAILKKQIKKCNKYAVWIEEEELKANNMENVEDIVVISKKEYDSELQKSNELKAKLESLNVEMQLKDLKIQENELFELQIVSKMEKMEESYKTKLNDFENKYIKESDELKHLLEVRQSEINELKAEMESSNESLQNRIHKEEELKKQLKIYEVSTVGLKSEIHKKEEELQKIKRTYENVLKIKSEQERELEEIKVGLNRLKNVQIEYDKLTNNYRHLQEVLNKKDENIIELEADKRKMDHYLLMSADAINNLKNLGLFNRLFNRFPGGIDELEEDIKKLQPPKEVEIEPVRVTKPRDLIGEKE